jgi:hypothetical protein
LLLAACSVSRTSSTKHTLVFEGATAGLIPSCCRKKAAGRTEDSRFEDIYASERVNLIGEPAHADRVAALKSLLATCNVGLFDPDRGKADPEACDQAIANGNFWGSMNLDLGWMNVFKLKVM